MDLKKLWTGLIVLMLAVGVAACDRQEPTGVDDQSTMQRSDESRDIGPSDDVGGAPGAVSPGEPSEGAPPNGGANP